MKHGEHGMVSCPLTILALLPLEMLRKQHFTITLFGHFIFLTRQTATEDLFMLLYQVEQKHQESDKESSGRGGRGDLGGSTTELDLPAASDLSTQGAK